MHSKYPYSTNKLSTKINTQNHYFLIKMQSFTNKDKKKNYKIILFLKSINYCNIYIYIYIYIFTNQNLFLLL